jgi:hypothetical protein
MAPHLTPTEQDYLLKWKSQGKGPMDIHARLEKARSRKEQECPNAENSMKMHMYLFETNDLSGEAFKNRVGWLSVSKRQTFQRVVQGGFRVGIK